MFIECKLNNQNLKRMKLYTATIIITICLAAYEVISPLLLLSILGLGAYITYRVIRGIVDPQWLDSQKEQSFGLDHEDD